MILERQPVILNDPLGGFWPRVLTRRSVGRSAWPQKKEHHISRPAAAAAYLNWFCDFGGRPRNRSSPFFRFSSPVASLFATAFGSNSISQRKNVMRVCVFSHSLLMLKEREIYAILINTRVYCRCRNTHIYDDGFMFARKILPLREMCILLPPEIRYTVTCSSSDGRFFIGACGQCKMICADT